MSIMIALVSEQRMQNIIPAFQKDAHFGRVWLVRSTDADDPDSRFGKALRDTRQALEASLTIQLAEPSVGAYGIEETQRIVSGIIAGAPQDVVINFTGGTKCMSVGAYLAAQNAGATALYVDTANEKLVWFHPGGRVEEQGFDLAKRLTVRIYLQANNRRVDEDRTRQNALPESHHAAARELLTLWPRCRDTLHALGAEVSRGGIAPEERVDAETVTLLHRDRFLEQTPQGWQVSSSGRNFLGGKWLDSMAYVLLEDSGLFDVVQPDLRLQGVEIELYVLATRNGQLAVLECKSGELGGQTTLNKLQTLGRSLGTFARTFFVTSRTTAQVDQAFRERARQYGVGEIITSDTLLKAADTIKNKMRGTPR